MFSLPFRFASLLPFAASYATLAVPGGALAAQGDSTAMRTTAAGVYTAAQAARGKEVYDLACLSCHKTVELANPKFLATLVDRPASDFFAYIRREMPQDNPGSLSDEDYASVIAYVFQLNAMPAGAMPLPADSSSLSRIRVAAPAPPDSSRKGPGR